MKAHILQIALATITGFLLWTASVNAQQWGGSKPTGLLASWTINVNGGFTSYFGDLSLHDMDVLGKLGKESGTATGIIVTKNLFGDAFGLSGQIIAGKLKGMKNEISFTSELLEYNVQVRIDFVDLFMLKRSHQFSVNGYSGIGQFLFSTNKIVNTEGNLNSYNHNSRVPEFVFFFGGGISYRVNEKFGFTADLALRQCQNDRLDDYIKNDDFDYYSYLSIGISYYVNTFKKAPLRNKARLANTSFMFHKPAQTIFR